MKAGFFHMKIRYYIIASVLDVSAFISAYSAMAHLIHYKEVAAQMIVLCAVFITGFLTAWNNNSAAMRLFEDYDKSRALLSILSEEVNLLEVEDKKAAAYKGKLKVMISYKHVDSEFAFKVEEALLASGYDVWIDKQIRDGIDWRAEIASAISKSQAVIFCVSPLAVKSKYCKEELYFASGCKTPIFPILYKDAFNDLEGGVKLILQRIQWADFSKPERFKENFVKFEAGLKKRMVEKAAKIKDCSKAIANGLKFGDVTEEMPSIAEGLTRVGREGEVIDGNLLDFDVFILADPMHDSALAHSLHKELSERKISVATVIDKTMAEEYPNQFRDTAMALLEKSGCVVFLQTSQAVNDGGDVELVGSFCAEMVHCAYESNMHIICLELEHGDPSPSLTMMMQMAPRICISQKQNFLDAEIQERLVYEIISIKYVQDDGKEGWEEELPVEIDVVDLKTTW